MVLLKGNVTTLLKATNDDRWRIVENIFDAKKKRVLEINSLIN